MICTGKIINYPWVFFRFLLTRDLIVLQQIMLSCGSPHEVPLEATEIIHSTFLPRCVVLNHSYFIISWINETHSTAPPNDSLEQVHIYPIFYFTFYHCTVWYFVTRIVLTCEKNCSSDREKLWKLEAEGWEFAKFLRSLEQSIPTVKGQNYFLV